LREYREEGMSDGVLDGLMVIDLADNLWVGALMAALVVLIAFVFLPLIGVALELILLALLIGSGLVGRVVLRRPWTVEAQNLDDGDSTSYAVKGWQRSGRAAADIASAIEISGPPERIAEGVKL
jgi:hypothetical protein